MLQTGPSKRHSSCQRCTYRDVYPSVDPLTPALSQKGKNIIITGGGQGVGRGIALGYAKAGAKTIVLAGRTLSKLEDAKAEVNAINKYVEVILIPTDVVKVADVDNFRQIIKEKVGVPDVLINSAGVWRGAATIADSDPDTWWNDIETNLKGCYLTTRAFLQLVGKEHTATIINLTSINVTTVMPGATSYHFGKLSITRMSQFLALEAPNVTSIALHPGIIATAMIEENPALKLWAEDTMDLAAGVAVYLSTPPAKYLSGRYVSVNWSVDDLKARESSIVEKDLLTFQLNGEFGSHLFE